jgi:glycine/D-amino acid oxidase-like deaminating enzyme
VLLQKALRLALASSSVELVPEPINALTRKNPGWQLNGSGGHRSVHDAVVICAALASPALIEPLGHSRPISPVLGQALALQCADGPSNWQGWPSVLVDQGFNLIPNGPKRLLLGSNRRARRFSGAQPLRTDAISERQSTNLVKKRRTD